LVRAANTGISAVIDPLGRIVGALPLGVEGVLDARLPAAIDPPPALSYSNYIVGLVVLLSLLIVGRRRIRA
jgi:apolipoprotein N-acyltransferase